MQGNYLINLIGFRPRRYRVIEGTLKGRQTVATLFWAQQYRIQGWFGYRRKLVRTKFDDQLTAWAKTGIVVLDQQAQTVVLTPAGQQLAAEYRRNHYLPQCGHLSWLVNTNRLAQRLLLAIQVVSEFAHQSHRYLPLDVSTAEMAAVKQWFYACRDRLVPTVGEECYQLAESLAKTDSRWPQLFVSQLVGWQTSGMYDQQLQRSLQVSADSLSLMKHDVWLAIANQLNVHDKWLLAMLVKPLLRRSPLSASAEQTLTAYLGGMDVQQISDRRHLKATTIREHLLAAAIQLPGVLDARQLIGKQRWQEFTRRYTGPVDQWHWASAATEDPAESFFAFRLYQIVRSQHLDG
ncbi:helix-turn-helix domain-containing protein [uncultured Limosilactobacillus sp.]|uniref:helix-turn-helix domain-containing protein n=1 Tax=uncultured Limosilactobacillus sp. TaxID=2837629 RepID=UPI0025EE8F6B|nr:helix-turn-helix domain-containing protein [uncultured Limosilactobacillus sp.]